MAQVPVYVGSQLVGALLAGLTLFVSSGVRRLRRRRERTGAEQLRRRGHGGYARVGGVPPRDDHDAVFVWVILAVTDARNEHPALAPLAIGLALTMIHFASITATGTSVNPARSIGVGALRRHRRDHPALAVHRRRRCSAPRSPASPTRCSSARAPTRCPAPGCASRGRAARCPGTARPTSSSRSGTSTAGRRATQHAAWEPEPIIQDGWQWDHQAQEWKPLEQWQPAPPPSPTTAPEPTTRSAAEQAGQRPGPPDDAAARSVRPMPQGPRTSSRAVRSVERRHARPGRPLGVVLLHADARVSEVASRSRPGPKSPVGRHRAVDDARAGPRRPLEQREPVAVAHPRVGRHRQAGLRRRRRRPPTRPRGRTTTRCRPGPGRSSRPSTVASCVAPAARSRPSSRRQRRRPVVGLDRDGRARRRRAVTS